MSKKNPTNDRLVRVVYESEPFERGDLDAA